MAPNTFDDDEGRSVDHAEKSFVFSRFAVTLLKILAVSIGSLLIIALVSYLVAREVFASRQTVQESNTFLVNSEEYINKPEILSWYEGIEEIRVTTFRDTPARTVTISVAIGYPEANINIQNELIRRRVPLRDLIRQYLSRRTADDILNEEQIKSELRAAINGVMISGEVRDIAFTGLNITN